MTNVFARAQGCLLGQLAGDALVSLVEFQMPEQIQREYPDGVSKLADGVIWDTPVSRLTSSIRLCCWLAHWWIRSSMTSGKIRRLTCSGWTTNPLIAGGTVCSGLRDCHNPDSHANGAMMRVGPLGIFGAKHDLEHVAEWVRQDARITHTHQVYQQVNALFAMAIAHAIRHECDAEDLYEQIVTWAVDMEVEGNLLNTAVTYLSSQIA